MKTNNILTITTTALATASLTVLTFWSASTEADGDAKVMQIAKPKLVANGVEMTLAAAEGKTFKAGEQPTFLLTAYNVTTEPANVAVRVAMSASSPADRLSRVPVIPAVLWQGQETLALKPNESKTISVSSGTKLPPNQHVSVSLQRVGAGDKPATSVQTDARSSVRTLKQLDSSIVAMNFSTAPVEQLPFKSVTR